MGKQGIGDANDNGDRLTTFCQENRLVIGGTILKHKNNHKVTCICKSQLFGNTIKSAISDILCPYNNKRYLKWICSYNTFDTGCQKDFEDFVCCLTQHKFYNNH